MCHVSHVGATNMANTSTLRVGSFIAGTLYLHVMKISAVNFPHSNGCCTEVILVVLHCVLHDLFLCFSLFIAVHCVHGRRHGFEPLAKKNF